jgi:hypothetical protein
MQGDISKGFQGCLADDLPVSTADHLLHPPIDGFDPVHGVQDHDPVRHTGKNGLQLPLLLIGRPDLFLEGCDDLNDIARQLPDFVAGFDTERPGGIPPSNLFGESRQLPDGGDGFDGKEQGEHQGEKDDQKQGLKSRSAQWIEGTACFPEGTGKSDVSFESHPLIEGNGHVNHLRLEGAAVPDGRAFSPQAGLLDLRPVEVIVRFDIPEVRIRCHPTGRVDQCQARTGPLGQIVRVVDDLLHGHQGNDARHRGQLILDQPAEVGPDLPFEQKPGDCRNQKADRDKGDGQFIKKANFHPFSAEAG